jgi:putative DNA primase/helicase
MTTEDLKARGYQWRDGAWYPPAETESVSENGDRPFAPGAEKFVPPQLGRRAEQEGHLRIGPGRSLWRYESGVYRPDGLEWLEGFARDNLGDEFREGRMREVKAWCKANPSGRLPTQPSTDYLNVANGILHWKETPPRLDPHSPDVPSVIQLPVEWRGLDGDCPRIFRFLRRVLPDEDTVVLVLEWIGYLLIPTARFKRAVMLEGPGDTGKSTLLEIIAALLGRDNVSHATLQSIGEDRFAAASLYGRLANLCADLDARSLQRSGVFKMITSGDPMRAERKYEQDFTYRPFARLMFSANEAPGTSDQSDAYYSRWLIVPMHNPIPRGEQSANIIRALTSPEELSGLLSMAVGALRRLVNRGRFEPSRAVEAASEAYRERTDTVVAFVRDRFTLDPEARERRSTVYDSYTSWCRDNGRQALGAARFNEHLEATHPAEQYLLHGVWTWKGLQLGTSSDTPLDQGKRPEGVY